MKSRAFLFVILLFFIVPGLNSCGGGGGGTPIEPVDECSIENRNKIVYDIMKDSYLWYKQVPDLDYTAYESPEALLEALKYKELDRWSYITSQEDYYNFFEEGKYIGLGFGLDFDDSGDYRVKYVYAGSPADEAGLFRGIKLMEIGGKTIDEISSNGLWDTVMGPDEVGTKVRIKIETPENMETNLELEKQWVTIRPVLYKDIFQVGGKKTGYMVFKTFIEKAHQELDKAFEDFSEQAIEELILDLRYNPGGRGQTAQYLADYIAWGIVGTDDVFARIIHNDKYSNRNRELRFSEPLFSLNLDRVFIITTDITCSASELLINSLRPYMDVVLIGSTTCGKPVGMYGHDFCESHLSPIEVKHVNADGSGDFYSGLAPACYSTDDIGKPFGDMEEASLKTAVEYIVHGSCPAGDAMESERMGRREKMIPLTGLRREIGGF